MDLPRNAHQLETLPAPWNTLLPLASKVLVWVLLFGTLYVLHSFFLLIFLTFVFAYLQSSGVEKLGPKIPSRIARVVIVAIALLSVLVGIGSFLAPQVVKEAQLFGKNVGSYIQSIDKEIVHLSVQYPLFGEIIPQLRRVGAESSALNDQLQWDPTSSPAMNLLEQFFGLGDERVGRQTLTGIIEAVRNIGARFFSAISAFLLSLLFSFLIVLDLPRLSTSVRSLKRTKLAFIYEEAAPTIYHFSRVLGRALEAQFFIALCNTALTAGAVFFLGIGDKVAFLSVIVFFCSFIPVAGVFISSVPICLLALQSGGFGVMFLAIGMITIIHMIEAYVLNPKIYGSHMRMNPVVVLIILTIGGTLFNIWGLVLGVPVCTYIFGHAIRRRTEE